MSKRKQPQQQYYNIRSLLSKNAIYNIIIGERSNGKTYAVLKYAVEQYFKDKSQFAILSYSRVNPNLRIFLDALAMNPRAFK